MKIKSIDKLERITDAATVRLSALVTFTDGLKDVQYQVNGEPINPTNRTTEQVETFIKASLQAAITAQASALDTAAVEQTKLDTLKTTILSDHSKAGLTVALALMLCLAPVLSWAGTLQPEWGDSTAVVLDPSSSVSGQVVRGQQRPTSMGTIDSSTYYVTHIWINAWEQNGSTGSLGVSVYAVDTSTGVSSYNLPMSVTEISNAETAIVDGAVFGGSGQADNSTGVTKYIGAFEGLPAISIAVGAKNASDTWYTKIKYKRMRGQY